MDFPDLQVLNINRRNFLKRALVAFTIAVTSDQLLQNNSANAENPNLADVEFSLAEMQKLAKIENGNAESLIVRYGLEAQFKTMLRLETEIQTARPTQRSHLFLGPNTTAYLENNVTAGQIEFKIKVGEKIIVLTQSDFGLKKFNLPSLSTKSDPGIRHLGKLNVGGQEKQIVSVHFTPADEIEDKKTILILAIDPNTGEHKIIHKVRDAENITAFWPENGVIDLYTSKFVTEKNDIDGKNIEVFVSQIHTWNAQKQKFETQTETRNKIIQENLYVEHRFYLSTNQDNELDLELKLRLNSTKTVITAIDKNSKKVTDEVYNGVRQDHIYKTDDGFVMTFMSKSDKNKGGEVVKYTYNKVTKKFDKSTLLKGNEKENILELRPISKGKYILLEETENGMNRRISVLDTNTQPYTKTIIQGIPAGTFDIGYDKTGNRIIVTGYSHTGPYTIYAFDADQPNKIIGGTILYRREWIKDIPHSVADSVNISSGSTKENIPYLEIGSRVDAPATPDLVEEVLVYIYGGFGISVVDAGALALIELKRLYDMPKKLVRLLEISGGGSRTDMAKGKPMQKVLETVDGVLDAYSKYPNAKIKLEGASRGGYNVMFTTLVAMSQIKQATQQNNLNQPQIQKFKKFIELVASVYAGVPEVDLSSSEFNSSVIEMGIDLNDTQTRAQISLLNVLGDTTAQDLLALNIIPPVFYIDIKLADTRTPAKNIFKLVKQLRNKGFKVVATVSGGGHLGAQSRAGVKEDAYLYSVLKVSQQYVDKNTLGHEKLKADQKTVASNFIESEQPDVGNATRSR